MWYPTQQQQQRQHNCYAYPLHHHQHRHHHSSQQQQTYSRTSYYCNTDELSTTYVEAINDENESSTPCQTAYNVTPSTYYVTTSLNPHGDEMSSYQTTPTRKTYWNPVIVAPTKSMNMTTSSVSVVSPPSSPTTATACWDWLLFSPQYYSELYTPLSTFVSAQKKEDDDDNLKLSFLASLPTCLLTLLYLTPKSIRTSDDENDSDQEIGSLQTVDELLVSINNIEKKTNNISSNVNVHGQKIQENRSSTPDTDDGYQSASDASRSDYSQQSFIPSDHHQHHRSRDDITINEHSLPTPLMPRRISYAAAVKPITATTTNKLSSLPGTIGKPKQTINNTLSNLTSANDMLNTNGQKLKFIAPRFERMHHAKQHSSSSVPMKSSSSNRTPSTRSTNTNQRVHTINPARRR